MRFQHSYIQYNPLPRDKVEKHIYRMLLLLAEKFQLTRPETGDLIFYASRFRPCFPKGGRNKSKERVFAFLCIYILIRDGRNTVLRKNWIWLNERYKLENGDRYEIERFVEKEVRRINNEALPHLWRFIKI